jgi:nicotinamidase-related amidase
MVELLERSNTVLLVVDIQEKLAVAIEPELRAAAIRNACLMIEASSVLGIPIVVTEQYPSGLGPTHPDIIASLREKTFSCFEKLTFSCMGQLPFRAALSAGGRKRVVITGMETHVCVYQTAVDLLNAGYSVTVLDDGVASRTMRNYQSGLNALRDAGCVVCSTESVVFQLLQVAGTPEFKKVLPFLK